MTLAAGPVKARAASLAKPKLIKKSCAYTYNKVCLKWKKVKGAKKYQIWRAKVNPKNGKTGRWKKWAVTKKTSLKKKGSGDYKYRICAVRGKKKSKNSGSVRIFGAASQITHIGYTPADIFFGVELRSARLEMRVLVHNKTKSPMGFLLEGTRVPVQSTIYAVNPQTGKKIKQWDAYLDTSGIAKKVNPGKQQSLYFYAFLEQDDWAKYGKCKFLITNTFYPNPEVEPMSKHMALASTKSSKESAIAGK